MISQFTVSVIIPTLNEETNLSRLLPQLQALTPPLEIIVSDGGSVDNSTIIAEKNGVLLCCEGRGRGAQLNAGADLATSDVLLFLHADSTLPVASYCGLLESLAAQEELRGGAFRFSLEGTPGLWPRLYEFNVQLRCRLLNLPYGDQGFFIYRSNWQQGLQFSDIPLMEDVEWWRRVNDTLKMCILPYPLITSARRFQKRGYLVSAMRNLWMLTRYQCGVSPFKLVEEYSK
ncbi:TIGR04283 family arsenosugar biosynthesis glycosyltransferase [Desulfopila sp. IMCC35008]|uniref:TIGR04283 family arsenosugar biosynthesis glycosyltransferase n=1 Tax=Desulfopila sp. IMCC35008 TaxID=2653858 RepID=UPI0013D0E552|nr:TIGR04283 family arsenosugar biosynthesis glycosyltransferase [Desulfopila sp. IMCC35008]